MPSQDDILKLIQQGDDRGIDLLFDEYFVQLCGVAFRVVHDSDIAKDIVQDVFIKLWSNRQKLHIQTSLPAYLRKSVANASIDHQRKAMKMHRVPLEQAGALSPTNPSDATDNAVHAADVEKQVAAAMAKLPPRCRLVFSLSRHEQLTYKEIAKKLDISTKTVENQMSKALSLLREYLAKLLALIPPIIWLFSFFFDQT